jgi:type IV secretory pathway protease TraF
MLPAYKPGQIVVAIRYKKLKPGNVVIINHNGLEKIKRISKKDGDKLFVLGDNAAVSTDSRQFGWLVDEQVLGKVIWSKC